MAIKKQEFYEGAAIHQLIRSPEFRQIQYDAPFFVLNKTLSLYLKYCTKVRIPWSFTFTALEQNLLHTRGESTRLLIGLVCGSDGIAAVEFDKFVSIASHRDIAIHVSCARKFHEHYAVSGPDGDLPRKIAPSNWQIMNVTGATT